MVNISNVSEMIADSETTKIINIFNYFLYTLIVVFGVPGNILVVWSLLLARKEKVNRSYKILVINLAINDIIMVLITSPFQISELILGGFPFGRVMCSILWPLQTACYGAGVFNMVALNVHRYYVISYPTSSRSLKKVTGIAVAMCWIIPSLITALPYALKLEYNSTTIDCAETWGDYITDVYTMYLFSVQYILPLIVIATLNLLTIRRLKRRYMFRLNTARLSADNLHAHKRIVKMLILIILFFALFGLPGQIMWIIPVVTNIDDNNQNYFAIRSLVDIFNYMYCVLNPVIFFAYNNECYERLKKLLASVLFCCGYRWEISSQTGVRHEAVTTLLKSRASDSQDTSASEGARVDSKYAPAMPKYLLDKLHENSAKDSEQRTVPAATFSSLTGLYIPAVSCHGNDVDKGTQGTSRVIKVAADDREIFRGSFVELLRTRNLSNDLVKRLDESPETAIVEEGLPAESPETAIVEGFPETDQHKL